MQSRCLAVGPVQGSARILHACTRCIALDMDCAEICRMATSYMARGSEFAMQLCAMCADVCEACGAECEKHEMAHCQECAEVCKRCAAECRRMAGAKGVKPSTAAGKHAH